MEKELLMNLQHECSFFTFCFLRNNFAARLCRSTLGLLRDDHQVHIDGSSRHQIRVVGELSQMVVKAAHLASRE